MIPAIFKIFRRKKKSANNISVGDKYTLYWIILTFTNNPSYKNFPSSGCISDLLGLVVLKLNVKTVLNSHFHLYGGVEFWISAECVHYNVHLFADVIQSPADGCPQEIAEGKNDIYNKII